MLIVLLLLVAVVLLFSLDIFPPDSVIIVALIALIVLGVLTPLEAFSGFGSNLIVILASIFIIGATLQQNGVMEYFASKMAKLNTNNYAVLLFSIMLPTGSASAFMSNTSVAALMVLPIKSLGKKLGVAPSRLLMPMAFATLVGGTSTLIGTSTNIAGNNFLLAHGMAPIGMFEFLPIGAVLLLFCIAFFILFGKKLLPENPDENIADESFDRSFYSSFIVTPGSKLSGATSKILQEMNVTVSKVHTSDGQTIYSEEYALAYGDKVFIEATSNTLKQFHNNYDTKSFLHDHATGQFEMAEVMVLPASSAVNRSIKESDLYRAQGLVVLGVFRENHIHTGALPDTVLRVGDILVVEGTKHDIARVQTSGDFIVLTSKPKTEFPHLRRGFAALAIFIIAIAVSALGWVPLSVALLSAVLALISFNILPGNSVYSKIDWRLIVLIGGMTAFGTAIVKTGADVFLANLLFTYLHTAPLLLIMFAFMVVTVLLTQPMSNAAAALVVLPVAVETASQLGADPRAFAVAVILAASISMITPFEPASLMVLGPGKYKITDFFKIGGTLTFCCLLLILGLIQILY